MAPTGWDASKHLIEYNLTPYDPGSDSEDMTVIILIGAGAVVLLLLLIACVIILVYLYLMMMRARVKRLQQSTLDVGYVASTVYMYNVHLNAMTD